MSIVHVVGRFAASVGAFEYVVRELPTWQMKSDFAARAVMLDRIFYTSTTSARLPAYEAIHQVKLIRILCRQPPRHPASGADIVHVQAADLFANFPYGLRTKQNYVPEPKEQGIPDVRHHPP